MKVERLLQILDGIQSQIRFLDTKAHIVLGIDGVMAGFLGVQAKTIAGAISGKWPSWTSISLEVFFVTFLLALMLSLFRAFTTVYPRTNFNQPESRIFFVHIAKRYNEDYKKISEDLVNMSDEDLISDVAKQILANSHVGLEKHDSLKKAVFWMGVSVFCWVWVLTLLFVATSF